MEFITKSRYARNDELINLIRNALSPDLLKPGYEGSHPMMGHCYVASEAYYHAMGGSSAGLKPKRMKVGDVVHWWLEEADGTVVDITHDQFSHEVDYSQGVGGGFLTSAPSKRSQELISRISKIAYDEEEHEEESDSYSRQYPVRWLFDEDTRKLYIWPTDPRDFEYKTHRELIFELASVKNKWDFNLGYITNYGTIQANYGDTPQEVMDKLESWNAENPEGVRSEDANDMEVFNV